jgi:hypothetical protein
LVPARATGATRWAELRYSGSPPTCGASLNQAASAGAQFPPANCRL